MGLRINSNILSQNAQRNLSNASGRLGGNFSRLSSGLRIASASDDAAGLGISERLRSQVRSLNQAGRNAQDGISLVQTAEAALGETGANLSRLRELAVQASNGTLSTGDRAVIDNEFTSLKDEISRVASDTNFNGVNLLDGGTTSVSLQVGIEAGQTIDVSLSAATTTGLGISATSFNVTTASGASTALAAIDTAINSVASTRGDLGATQNRLSSTVRSIATSSENLAAAETRIRDVDVAFETADLTRNSILQQAALSVLSQANVQPQLALSLLG
jgi:flagellin